MRPRSTGSPHTVNAPGSTSLFACVPTGPDSPLSFRMRLYEAGQSAPVACYAWGDPEGLPAECTLVEPTF
jgi:hypothetical protein